MVGLPNTQLALSSCFSLPSYTLHIECKSWMGGEMLKEVHESYISGSRKNKQLRCLSKEND